MRKAAWGHSLKAKPGFLLGIAPRWPWQQCKQRGGAAASWVLGSFFIFWRCEE